MSRAKKKTVNGITFDSITEADYYSELLKKQYDGEIFELQVQPQFTLMESFQLRKRKIRGMVYTPDFMYQQDDDTTVVVEVKGYARKDYLMRRKLFLYIHGEDLTFHEVKRKGKDWKISIY